MAQWASSEGAIRIYQVLVMVVFLCFSLRVQRGLYQMEACQRGATSSNVSSMRAQGGLSGGLILGLHGAQHQLAWLLLRDCYQLWTPGACG